MVQSRLRPGRECGSPNCDRRSLAATFGAPWWGGGGYPELSPFVLGSYPIILGGFWLVGAGWLALWSAAREGRLATTEQYAALRHPQYVGFSQSWVASCCSGLAADRRNGATNGLTVPPSRRTGRSSPPAPAVRTGLGGLCVERPGVGSRICAPCCNTERSGCVPGRQVSLEGGQYVLRQIVPATTACRCGVGQTTVAADTAKPGSTGVYRAR